MKYYFLVHIQLFCQHAM